MKRKVLLAVSAALAGAGLAAAQTNAPPPAAPAPAVTQPGSAPAIVPPPIADPNGVAAPAASAPVVPPANAVLELKALDKITGKASVLMAPLNKPVKYATLTITARTCYSTPPSETPETSAFLQIDDKRPDQPERKAFSGWMYASSPGLNSLQHPLYDVWVISCITNAPGQHVPAVASAPVKPVSPNAGANEAMPTLPEDAGQ